MVVCEGTDFSQFLLWEGVVVLKELIFHSFYFGMVWWSWKNWFFHSFYLRWKCDCLKRTGFWTVSTLGGCGGLERTDFKQFVLWEGVLVLKERVLNSFYFGRMCWSLKNWFWTVSTLGKCDGLERTDYSQFLLWEGVLVLKELGFERTNFEQFLLWENVVDSDWWPWKNWFSQFLLWDGVVVLIELIFKSFYFGRKWWSW